MASQVQSLTLERPTGGRRQRLCRLTEGQGGLPEALTGIEVMRMQPVLAGHLTREFGTRIEPAGVRPLGQCKFKACTAPRLVTPATGRPEKLIRKSR